MTCVFLTKDATFFSYSHSPCSCLSELRRQPSCNVTAKVSNNIIVEMIPLINPLLSSIIFAGNDKIKQQPVTSNMCISSFSGWVLSFD